MVESYAGEHGGCLECDSNAEELRTRGHRANCKSPYAKEKPRPRSGLVEAIGILLGVEPEKKEPMTLQQIEQLGRDYAAAYRQCSKAMGELAKLNREMLDKGIREVWGVVVDGYAHSFISASDDRSFGCGAAHESKIDHRHDELGLRCEAAWADYSRKAILSNEAQTQVKSAIALWLHQLTCECNESAK